MKTINVTFTDEQFARLVSHKAFLMMNWNDYIINCTEFVRGNEKFMEKHAKDPSDLKVGESKEETE